jgi:hypothetical protein
VLTSGTVRDNLRYARPAADDAEIEAAARAAAAHDFITQPPDGYDTFIGEGSSPSRPLIRPSPVIRAPRHGVRTAPVVIF